MAQEAQEAQAASEPFGADTTSGAAAGALSLGGAPDAGLAGQITLGKAVAIAVAEILAERSEQMNMPWPPIVAETTAPAAPAGTLSPDAALLVHGGATSVRLRASTSGAPSDARARTFPRLAAPTMALGSAAIPPPHRTRPRSKWDHKLFVRKAAFMSVLPSVPRMVAYPPSPPSCGRRSGYRHLGGASSGAETGSEADSGSSTAADGEAGHFGRSAQRSFFRAPRDYTFPRGARRR